MKKCSLPAFLIRTKLYFETFNVIVKGVFEFFSGTAPPVVAEMVTVYVPAGVPGLVFPVPPLPPPHEPNPIEQQLRTTIIPSRRMPRLPAPAKITPNRPGSKRAYTRRLSLKGRRIRVVGPVVVRLTVTAVAFVGWPPFGSVHAISAVAKAGLPVHVYVTGTAVVALAPLPTIKLGELVLLTAICTAAVPPAITGKVEPLVEASV
jgi:hypothetical protein